VLRLYEPTSGRILFEGKDVTKLRGGELKEFRRNAQMVFQDPHTSLNPRLTIAETLLEPLREHGVNVGNAEEYLAKQLETVGLGSEHLYRYPHELSGGQKQRVAILRAIILRPKFVVLDEPYIVTGCLSTGSDPGATEGPSEKVQPDLYVHIP
jgi:peptide/nickel transport system ATP-binding protein